MESIFHNQKYLDLKIKKSLIFFRTFEKYLRVLGLL